MRVWSLPLAVSNIRAGVGEGNLGDKVYYLVVLGSALVMVSAVLLIFQLRHRALYSNELSKEQRDARDTVIKDIEVENAKDSCSFWFVSADYIRQSPELTLPRFQLLSKQPGEPLKRISILKADAYSQSKLRKEFLTISHRWLDPVKPDVGGEQMRALKQHLAKEENKSIQWVWYDVRARASAHGFSTRCRHRHRPAQLHSLLQHPTPPVALLLRAPHSNLAVLEHAAAQPRSGR